MAEQAINDKDDPFKDLTAEEFEETINEVDEVPDEQNAAVCWISMLNYQEMEINQVVRKPLQKYEGKLSNNKKMISMLFIMNRQHLHQHSRYKEPLRLFNSLYFFATKDKICEKFFSKVNTYSQRAIAKRKKQKLLKTTLIFDLFK